MFDDNEKVSANIEEYLKIIYQLSGDEGLVKTTSIAKSLSIAPGSVTRMLKKWIILVLWNISSIKE